MRADRGMMAGANLLVLLAAMALPHGAAAAQSPSVPALPAPNVAHVKLFSDWAAACDNGGICRAVTLQPAEGDYAESALALHLTRAPTADSSALLVMQPMELGGREAGSAAVDFLVTGGGADISLPAVYDAKAQGWAVKLTSALAQTLRDGRQIVVRAQDGGAIISAASLAGFTATALYFDEQQGRAKGVTALLARGPRPSGAIPSRAAIPAYHRPPQVRAAPYRPSAVQWAHLARRSECDVPDSAEGAVAMRLDAATTLLEIPCFSGAYNRASAYYIARQGAGGVMKLEPAPLDHMPETPERGGAPILVNSGYDSATGILTHYAKARGLGDCGESAQWVWDGRAFRLTARAAMEVCRGADEFLTLWRARVLPANSAAR